MKFFKFFLLFALSLGLIIFASKHFSQKSLKNVVTPIAQKEITPQITPVSQKKSIFVPYWTIKNGTVDPSFDTYLYFGITANQSGINTAEPGYLDLEQFSQKTEGKEKILVIRLLDQKTIDGVFADANLKQKIIQETITTAKKYGFTGVAIDLEYPSLAFSSVTNNISSVITDFAASLKKQNIKSFVTMYGDTFYRVRPFNVKDIGEKTDGVFIMAYDFHKAKGNPGPNFPLEIGDDENYSFQTMITDFSAQVPKEKLTVIFGMFGYDWKVTDKGMSLTEGDPLSTADIEKLFVTTCSQKQCKQTRNTALEPSVTYTDTDGNKHTIWYEDTLSMGKKVQYLQTKGIGNTAVWAHSYF